jgi:Tol biopolymer transport system component
VRAGLRDLMESVPVTPPPAAVLRRRAAGRVEGRPVWRRAGGLVPSLAAAAVAAVLLVAVVPGWLPSPVTVEPADTVDQPVLPERFAGKIWRTASVIDAPPGPAIATFVHGTDWRGADLVIVGADGASYRRLSLVDLVGLSTSRGHDVRDPLLSPDGTRLAGSSGYVIDLTTMTGQWYPILPSDTRSSWGANPLLAWSPDGRRLAYSVGSGQMPRPAGSDDGGEGVALLDLVTGDIQFIHTGGAGPRVAFSPDGTEIAVSTALEGSGLPREFARHIDADPGGSTIMIFGLDGQPRRELSAPSGTVLVPHGGWSPDGTLLVVQGWGTVSSTNFSFVDPTGSGAPVPAPVGVDYPSLVEMVGWRGPDTLLVAVHRGHGYLRWLLEVPVDGGASRVRDHTVSEFMVDDQDRVADLRLASGLLADAEIRDPGRPQHGPLPVAARANLAGAAALLLVVGGFIVRWRVRRSERATAVPYDGAVR